MVSGVKMTRLFFGFVIGSGTEWSEASFLYGVYGDSSLRWNDKEGVRNDKGKRLGWLGKSVWSEKGMFGRQGSIEE